jgi:2-(1,2-epoxy-1,2-dihydrophenyl)acetyl-CoA isomerase
VASDDIAGVPVSDPRTLAGELYDALSRGDRGRLDTLLHPRFEGRTTAGLPLGLGGAYSGSDAMRRDFWGRIARNYRATAEPAGFEELADGRLVVFGRYTGQARGGGGVLDAEFAHLLSFADGRIVGLVQLTDSQRWHEALGGALRTVEFSVDDDGIAVLRLNRPDARNAINPAMAEDMYEVAQRCAVRSDLRALLVTGNGPAFTVGGDIEVFGAAESAQLPSILRRMVTPYHEALRIFAELPAPVVAAAHGSVAGGGLGLIYCADVVIAAAATKFAAGFGGLGLSGDGGNSWYLPRLVGLRRAQDFYFRQRVLDADEALEWGLVSQVVPEADLAATAWSTVARLAAGPTRAYAEIRDLLRKSSAATLSEQLTAETEALARTAATVDAAHAARAFLAKSRPTFEGH